MFKGFTSFLIGLVVIGAFVFSEWLTTDHPKPGPVRIVYWEKWTADEFKGIKSIVDDFNKSQNRIFVDILSTSDIGNKTLLSVSAGVPPDVAGLWAPNVAQYAEERAIEPLDEYCRQWGISEKDYKPVYWAMVFHQGHIFALPSTPIATALHYNPELLEKAGIDPNKPPQTAEELYDMAAKVTTRDKTGKIAISGFLPAEPGWWNWVWGYMWGGALWDGNSKLTCDSPENIAAFEWVQSFSKKFGSGDIQAFRSGFGNFSSPQNAFMEKKVAMELQGVYMCNFIQKYGKGMKWAASPFPYPKDKPEMKNWVLADADVLVIPRGAKHPKEAFEFIRFVQTQKEMEKLCISHRKNSPLRAVSENFKNNHPNPYIRLFDDLAAGKNAIYAPMIGMWPEYNSELNNAFEEINLLRKTPKEALRDVRIRMQPKFDQYLERRRKRGAL